MKFTLCLAFVGTCLLAQEQPQVGVLYKCSNAQNQFKITQCADGNAGVCDIQLYTNGAVQQSVRMPRSGLTDLVKMCMAPPPPAAAQFKVGDYAQSQLNGAGEWLKVQVIGLNGDGVVSPTDPRYRYHIKFPNGVMAFTDSLRPLDAAAAPKAPAKAAAPLAPKPGLVSCAGKFEGRYATTGGPSNFQIVFRAGKATIKAQLLDDQETECWTGGGKIYLHKPGESNDLAIDINDDGTLQTPFGEIKRKGN